MRLHHFTPCRSIGAYQISRSDTHRALLINDELIIFTPTEYRLLCILLEHENVRDSLLLREIFSKSSKDRCTHKTLERHIDNIRSKLHTTGLSLRRIYRFGYALVVAEEDSERAAREM